MSAVVLGKRLKAVAKLFQFCVIDAPPQRSQLALTTIGAADYAIVTAEASSKGVNFYKGRLGGVKICSSNYLNRDRFNLNFDKPGSVTISGLLSDDVL